MDGLIPEKKGRYISIKADGKLHETVTKDTEGAVYREYETSSGEKGEKWELIYQEVKNVMITKVAFEEGDYGENLQLTLSDGENEIVLSQGVSTNFSEDLLKKLPAVDFSEKVTLVPYAFENEKGKQVRGVNIYQKSDKVMNFFWDDEKKVKTHGFPEPEGNTALYSKDEWKAYYLKARIFLVKYAKERIVPKFRDDTISPADIPFD